MAKKKQEIKEEAAIKTQEMKREDDLKEPLPKILLTEEEMNQFASSLATGIPFKKSFAHPKAPEFVLVFRDKTKKESEIIGRSLDRAFDDKKILNWTEYTHAFNVVSIYYQLESINKIPHVREYPATTFAPFDVMDAVERSPVAQWTSSQLYVAMGFMFQFNQALLEASKEAFSNENFS
jgi:hypothetical protein